MAKTLLQYVAELKEVHDQQSQLALKEQDIMHEIAKFDMASSIQQIVSEHVVRTQPPTHNTPAWNIGLKIDKKALSILKRKKHIMTNREVCEAIGEVEQNTDPEYIKMLIRKFSAVVGGKAKNGRTFRRIDIDGVYYFALPDWFNLNGDLLPEYDQPE